MPLPPHSRLIAPVLALLFFSARGRAAEIPAPVYHAAAAEVRLSFFATGEHGQPQTNLKKDDFAIIDDGEVMRDFISLNEGDEDFLDIVLLLDASESVAEDFKQMARFASWLVSAKELAVNTNISLMTFSGTRSALLCEDDCRDSHPNLLSATPTGATPLLDAISDASAFLSHRHRPGTKPVIVLFSDGLDTSSRSSIQGATRSLENTEVVLYAVDVRRKATNGTDGSAMLRRITEASGGVYFTMGESTTAALLDALGELRHSYIVTYKPEHAASGYHSLRILPTRNLSLQFHSRSGYYYGTDR